MEANLQRRKLETSHSRHLGRKLDRVEGSISKGKRKQESNFFVGRIWPKWLPTALLAPIDVILIRTF